MKKCPQKWKKCPQNQSRVEKLSTKISPEWKKSPQKSVPSGKSLREDRGKKVKEKFRVLDSHVQVFVLYDIGPHGANAKASVCVLCDIGPHGANAKGSICVMATLLTSICPISSYIGRVL